MTPDAVVSRGGFSAARLARLHDALRRHVGPGRLPGLVAAIDRRGSEHVDAIGSVAFDRSEPMRRDTLFRLASVAKPITAVAAMILVEECRLRLDDAVDDLLPLSTFTFPGSADEFMQAVGRLPLAHQPGERWLYHMSAEILGVLIARAAGRPLSAFMRERIFEPLGMKDTGFSVAPAQLDRVATCYQADPATGEISVLEGASNELLAHPCTFESGAGDQMVSTADDLLAFGRMMRDGGACGNGRILSRPTIELMTTDQLSGEQQAASPFFGDFWDARGWGLGVSVVTRRREVAGSPGRFGWDGVFSTSWYVDLREQLVGVLMAQCRPARLGLPPVVLDFWTAASQAIDD